MSRHATDCNAVAGVERKETSRQGERRSQDSLGVARGDSLSTETVLGLEEPVQISQKRSNVSTKATYDHGHTCNQSVCLCPKIPKLSDEGYESLRPLQHQERASRDITIEVKGSDPVSASVVSTGSSHDVMSYCSVENLFKVSEHPRARAGGRDGRPAPPLSATRQPKCVVGRSDSNEDLEQEMIRALKRTPSKATGNPYSSTSQQRNIAVQTKNDSTALCSFRFCRKNCTELVVQKVSSSVDGYTVTGITSLTSVGSTMSEPQPLCEERVLFFPVPESIPPAEEYACSPLSDPRTLCINRTEAPLSTLSPLCKGRGASPMEETQLDLCEEGVCFSVSDSPPLCKELLSSSTLNPTLVCDEPVLRVPSEPSSLRGERANISMSYPQPLLGQRAFVPVSSRQLCGQQLFSPIAQHRPPCKGQTALATQMYCEEHTASPLLQRKRLGEELDLCPANEPKRVCTERAPSPAVSAHQHVCEEQKSAGSSMSQSTAVCKEVPTSSVLSTEHEPQHPSEDRTQALPATVKKRDTPVQHDNETGISDPYCLDASHGGQDSVHSMAHCSDVIGDHCVSSAPLLNHLATGESTLPLTGNKGASAHTQSWNNSNASGAAHGPIISRQPYGETVGVGEKQQLANANDRAASGLAPWPANPFRQATTAAELSLASPPEKQAPDFGSPQLQSWRCVVPRNGSQCNAGMDCTQTSCDGVTSGVAANAQTVDTATMCSIHTDSTDAGCAVTVDAHIPDNTVIESTEESSNGVRATFTVGTQTIFSSLEADPTYKSQGQATNDEVCGSHEQFSPLETQQQKQKGALRVNSRTKLDHTLASSGFLSFFQLLQSNCPFLRRLDIDQLACEHIGNEAGAGKLHPSDYKRKNNTSQRSHGSETQLVETRYQQGSYSSFGEGHPLRQFWEQTRSKNHLKSQVSLAPKHLDQGSTCEDESEDWTQEEGGESDLSKTASSLELDENLHLAKVTAIQNQTSGRGFIPLSWKFPSTQGGEGEEARPQTRSRGRDRLTESLGSTSGSGYCSTGPSVRFESASRRSCSLALSSRHSVRSVDQTQLTSKYSYRSPVSAEMHASVQFLASQRETKVTSKTWTRDEDASPPPRCTVANPNSLPTRDSQSARSLYEISDSRRGRSRSPTNRSVDEASSSNSSGISKLSSHTISVCGRSACARRVMDRSSSEGSFLSHRGRSGSSKSGRKRKGSCPTDGTHELQSTDPTVSDQPTGKHSFEPSCGLRSTITSDMNAEEEDFLMAVEASPVRKTDDTCELCLGMTSDDESRLLAEGVVEEEEVKTLVIVDMNGEASPRTLPLFDNAVAPRTNTARRKLSLTANQRPGRRFHNFSNNTVIPSVSSSRESDKALRDENRSKVDSKGNTLSKDPNAEKKVNFMRDQAPQTSPDVPGRRTFPIFSFHNPDVSALYEPNSLFAQSGLPSFSPVSTEKENDGVLTQKESNASRRSPQPNGVESRQSPRRTKSAAGRKRAYVGPFSGVGSSSKTGTADGQRDLNPDDNSGTSQIGSVTNNVLGDSASEEQKPRSDRKSTNRKKLHRKHPPDPGEGIAEEEEEEEEGNQQQRGQGLPRDWSISCDPEAPPGTRHRNSGNFVFKVRLFMTGVS